MFLPALRHCTGFEPISTAVLFEVMIIPHEQSRPKEFLTIIKAEKEMTRPSWESMTVARWLRGYFTEVFVLEIFASSPH